MALKSLASNKTIVIMKPDKGNGVVLMHKVDYISKVDVILSDVTKCKLIDKDIFKLMIHLEDETNRFLRSLKTHKITEENTYHDRLAKVSQPNILYGLPKVHKLEKTN